MGKLSNFKDLQEAVKVLDPLLDLIPTGFQTTPNERADLTHAVSALVSFVEKYPKRSRKRKNGEEDERRADWLDEQGVKLWNKSTAAYRRHKEELKATSQTPQEQDAALLAHIKYAGFKLIDAATVSSAAGPSNPFDLVRLVLLSAKTAVALLDAGDSIKANNLLIMSADMEKKLLDAPEPTDPAELEEKVSALVSYYLARSDLAAADFNVDLAFSMTQNAFGKNVGVCNFKMVAAKFWKVGNLLRSSPDKVNEACLWLQKGLEVIQEAEKMDAGVGIQDIRVALLRTTARAELSRETPDGGSLDRATSALKELSSIANTLDSRSVHEIKILQLNVLQQQNAKEGEVLSTLSSVMNTLSWDDEQVTEILGEILSLQSYKDLQSHARQTLLSKAVEDPNGHSFVARILLSILLAVRKQEMDFQTAIRIITQALEKIAASGVQLNDEAGVLASQTILWSFGEKAFGKQYTHAAEWYILCTHKAFYPLGEDNFSKCWRKAALAYINDSNMPSAQTQLDRCPSTEAATQYLGFLVAATQGRNLAATSAAEAILNCPDLDGKQLLLMAQVASEKGLDSVLTSCLKSMLTAISRPDIAATVQVQSIVFIQCLVKMNVDQMRKAEDPIPFVETLVEYLSAAINVIDELNEQGEAQQNLKGIAWLYKTAYNSGVEQSMKCKPGLVAQIFDSAALLMDQYLQLTTLDADPDLPLQRATAMFSCLCGNLFVYRDMDEGYEKDNMLHSLMGYIESLREVLAAIKPTDTQTEKLSHISRTVAVMEAEVLCEQGNWGELEGILEEAMASNVVTRELEAVITVLAKYRDCPTTLMIRLLERVLRSASFSTVPEIFRLSRWTRSLVTSLLHRGARDDEQKAQYFVNRALQMIESEFGNKAYPEDEQMWLVSTAWARGTGSFSKGNLGIAMPWCKLAITLAKFVKGAQKDYDNMLQYYERMFSKLGVNPQGNTGPRPRAIMN